MEHVTIFLIWAVCLIGIADPAPTGCDDGWLAFRGNCYLFAHYPTRFAEAENYCRQHKGHLIEPTTLLDNDFIKDRLREFKPHCFWIGVTDELVEGHWRLYTSDMAANFTDWEPTDNYHTDQDCGVFWPAFDYRWADLACNLDCSAICQRKGAVVEETMEIVG